MIGPLLLKLRENGNLGCQDAAAEGSLWLVCFWTEFVVYLLVENSRGGCCDTNLIEI